MSVYVYILICTVYSVYKDFRAYSSLHYRPQWTPLTPPGPIPTRTSNDLTQAHRTSPSASVSTSPSGLHYILPEVTSYPSYSRTAPANYQPYSTLLSACNPPPPSSTLSYTGTTCGQWSGSETSQPTMTSLSVNQPTPTNTNSNWCEQYGYGTYTTQPYNYPAFNATA